MRSRHWALCALAGLTSPAGAQTVEPWQAPILTTTRYDEDWSDLADATKRAHHWTGAFKYVPLAPDLWLSTGTELRLRNETYRANLWGGGAASDDSFVWARALPYADLHWDASASLHLRSFVQPIASYAISVAPAPSAIDQSRVDLLQGFGEVDARLGPVPVTLRAGRQMVSLGTERLIGTRYGPNTPLAFDGFRAALTLAPRWRLDLLAVKPVTPGPGSFDDHTSPTRTLWGAYAAGPTLDLYTLVYRNATAHFGGRTGRELRTSLGARSHGQAGAWHWNVEAVYQFGRFGRQRIAAWTVGSEVGRVLTRLPLRPDATLRFNVVSGDGSQGTGALGSFNAMFPKGKYFGELSPIGPTNIVNLNPRIGAKLGHGWAAGLAAMAYWRESRADGIYDIPGNLLRGPGVSGARFIGKQTEATASWQATPELTLAASASAFVPGGFIRATGPARTILMTGLEANFRF